MDGTTAPKRALPDLLTPFTGEQVGKSDAKSRPGALDEKRKVFRSMLCKGLLGG